MDSEKQQYIQEQVEIDYVMKSKNSAIAFVFVTILFIYLQKFSEVYKAYILILSIAVIILSVIRFLNAKIFAAGKRRIENAVTGVTLTVLFNCIFWCAIAIMSLLSFEDNNFQIIITFIILIAISASSIVTISHKRSFFLLINFMLMGPQVFYSVIKYQQSNDASMLWIAGYAVIFTIYNITQGKVVANELARRFSMEYDLKKTLEEVALSKKHLEEESIKTFHASRLSSLGEMAGGVAHEINNPLAIIQGMTKYVLTHNENKLDETSKLKLLKINSATERIAKIVKGMKIISSKNDKIEHESTKISKIVDVSLSLFEERIKNESITFTLENVTDPMIMCNPLQVSQILINLISNALDALKNCEGDKILTLKVTEDFLHHTVEIRVINSGELLTQSILDKIFEPFFSTKALGQGTGLGLSISRTLAISNGGQISYEVYQGHICFKLHFKTHTI